MNRSIRSGSALAGIAGMAVLAGCGAVTVGASSNGEDGGGSSGGDASAAPAYADGTYTADGTYQTPETLESVTVTVTLEDDIVTAVEVTGDPQAPETEQYQSQFIDGIADEVVGVDIDELSVSRVAGSSLTSGGFNAAIDRIKQDAAV
ncbi:hypothetical protein GCM10022219_02540 [Microbacterium oryzae]|uniref:FMN-binding protein n=1 Tax=Microbacterium oryzae TaxID=743009 RepID=A0A6I6E1J6_9MICO|nr:FMN-binding protein [Microbacterium oryzae]QGU26430.1 FMN-binding protein [Microbacterium oryzae]